MLAEFGASSTEVELNLVIERRWGAWRKDFHDFNVEVVLENILEAVGGFEKLGTIKWVSEAGFADDVIEEAFCYTKVF